MSPFNKTSRLLLNIFRIGMLQVRSIRRTCNKNVLSNLTLQEVKRKPSVVGFLKTDTKSEDKCSFDRHVKRSFRKIAMEHQTDTFELNGFLSPMSSFGVYSRDHSAYPFATNWRWYVTSKDRGGPVRESGGRLGKLDAKGEAGFFHKVSLSRLQQIKRMLQEKKLQKVEAPKDDAAKK